jgi:hypothetical protein
MQALMHDISQQPHLQHGLAGLLAQQLRLNHSGPGRSRATGMLCYHTACFTCSKQIYHTIVVSSFTDLV